MTFWRDTAVYIWTIAGELFPEATQIVDRFHVKLHLSDVAKAIYGPDRVTSPTVGPPNAAKGVFRLSKVCTLPRPRPEAEGLFSL